MALGRDETVSRKRYLELVHTLADKAQKAQRKSDVTTRQLAVEETEIG